MDFETFRQFVQGAQLGRFDEEGGEGAVAPHHAKRGGTAPSGVYDVGGEFDVSACVWSPPVAIPDVPSDSMVAAAVAAAAAEMRAGEGVEVTPPTDRGVKFTIHGATLTVYAPVDEVADALCTEYFSDFVGFIDRGLDRFEAAGRTRFYDSFYRGPHGMNLSAAPLYAGDHVSVELKGEVFEVYGVAPFARLLASLHQRGWRWHCTRIDAAWDHHEITPQMMMEACEAGNLRSLTEHRNWDWRKSPEGQTCYFGSRNSSGLVRCYNRRGFNRLEMENRQNRAKFLGLQLVNTPLEEWSDVCMGYLRGFVDFVDASSDKCTTRRRLLPWWAEFVGSCEKAKIRLSDGFNSIARCAAEVVEKLKSQHRRIGRSVAVLREALGEGAFKRWLGDALEAFEPRHRVRVTELKQVLGSYAENMCQSVEDLLFDRGARLAL